MPNLGEPRKQPRDIVAGHNGELDLVVLQRRILAGAEMKTAIKRSVDELVIPPEYPSYFLIPRRRAKELKKAMEAWCNAG